MLASLRPHLVDVELPTGVTLHHENVAQRYVFFPTSGIVSMGHVLGDGALSEFRMVGNDGVVGLPALLRTQRATSRSVVQVGGRALRASAATVERMLRADAQSQDVLLRYVAVVLTEVTQTAFCNRHHSLAQQFCRWLLSSLDRLPSPQLQTTQQAIATMLGARRESVSAMANDLKADGVIDYSRGTIRVLDRKRLEALACSCYASVVAECARLLPATRPRQARLRDG
jgi:CRP-like cAMP-binding protein